MQPRAAFGGKAVGYRSPSPFKELLFAGAALVGLASLVAAPHLQHGGFYSDDWLNASFYWSHGYREMAVHFWRDLIPWRPVLAFLLPLPHALFGLDATYHLLAAFVLGALASLSFFVFLRAFGVEFHHALALSLLSLVFPWSGALRLWATASMNNVALIAYFLGSVTALRALSLHRGDRHRRATLHVIAAGFYLVSVLTYEVAAAAIVFSGLLYRTQLPWRTLRRRWLVDAALVLVPVAALAVPTSHARRLASLRERAADVPEFVSQGASVFASSFLPRDISSPLVKLLVLAAVGVIVAAALWTARRPDEGEVRKWLVRAAGGIFAVGLGYLMFLGYGLYPLSEGIDDRVNAFSAFGFVVAIYSVLALLGVLVARGSGPWAAGILAAGTLLVGLGFVQRTRDEIGRYDAATAQQNDELARLRALLPRPPHGSTIFTFGYPTVSAPGVPIFSHPWDLSAAVRLRWNDPSLRAIPVEGRSVSCGRSEVSVRVSDNAYTARYDHAEFVDLSTMRARHIASRRECLESLTLFESRGMDGGG